MLRAGNDLKFQLLSETDFRSVVTMNGNALEDFPEISFQLGVRFGNGVAMARADDAIDHDCVVDGTQLGQLLLSGGIDEVFAVQRLALLIDARETIEKMSAFVGSRPLGEDQID